MIRKSLTQLIITLIVAFASVAGYVLWYVHVGALTTDSKVLGLEIKQKTSDSTRTAAIKNSIDDLEANEDSAKTYFVGSMDVVGYLSTLEMLGDQLGTKVKVLSVSADTLKPSGHLNVSLTIDGTFSNVIKTLGAIEYQPYDTVTKSVTVDTSKTASASSTPIWSATAIFSVGTATSTAPRPTNVITAPAIKSATTTATTTPTLTI